MIHEKDYDYLNPPKNNRGAYIVSACMGLIPVALLIIWSL